MFDCIVREKIKCCPEDFWLTAMRLLRQHRSMANAPITEPHKQHKCFPPKNPNTEGIAFICDILQIMKSLLMHCHVISIYCNWRLTETWKYTANLISLLHVKGFKINYYNLNMIIPFTQTRIFQKYNNFTRIIASSEIIVL